MICTDCGFNNQAAAKFCGGCGSPLRDVAATKSQAERRILSVIFCDIVGATTLSEKVDPEEFRELLQSYHTTCFDVVRSYDGFLADLMGDGVVIYFGYPTAHEDDEVRTVRCAMALIDAVRSLSSRVKHPFEVRIGAHRGLVVVGSLGGAGGLHSLAIGETPNVAARLQAEAQPGELVISDSLWRLVNRYFEGVCLGSRRLKGLQRPIEIHQILAHRSASRYKGTAEHFIGRVDEQQKAQTQWHKTLKGHCQALIIRGEPGIGKSRFIQLIKTEIADSRTLVMETFCSQFSADTPYFPVCELIRNRLGLNDLDQRDQLEQLRMRLLELGLPIEEAVPLIAQFLSLHVDAQDWPVLTELSLSRQRQRTHQLLVMGLKALASEEPVLLVIEDLHWSDASTIEFLDELLHSRPLGRLMIVLSVRLEFQTRWHELGHVTEINLDALKASEAESLIRDIASGKPMPLEIVRQICLRSSGNPLFLEEITLSVIYSAIVVEREQTWELVQAFSAEIVPDSMEAALMARLDQLGAAKELLQLGATIGREFSLDILAALSTKTQEQLEDVMNQLVDSGLLQASSNNEKSFVFKHALVQEVAYKVLLRSTRQEYHARIATVIDASFPDLAAQRPDVVARHLSGAGCYGESARLWLVAGQSATERLAVHEAIEHLKRGLADLSQVSKDDERWDLELSLLTALAPAQMATVGWASPIVNTTCRRASELAERVGLESRRFAPLWGLWSNQFVSGSLGEALQTCSQLLQLSILSGLPMHELAARNAASYTHFYRSEFEQAIENTDQGLGLFDMDLEHKLCLALQSSPTVHIMSARSKSLWMLGFQEEAYAGMKGMVELARSLHHPPSLATALAYMCLFYYFDQNWLAIIDVSDEVMELSSCEGFALWHTCGRMYKAAAVLALEENNDNIDEVLASADLFRQTGTMVSDPSTSTIVIAAYRRAGRLKEALAESIHSVEKAAKGEVGVMVSEILRCQSEILYELRRYEEAEQAIRQAIKLASVQSARPLILRAQSTLLNKQ
jgi:class 3 adenylate cyclase/tetratricopeptide (TPR) repeat protein